MSGIGNSTVQPIQTSEHDQNPYLIAADLLYNKLITDNYNWVHKEKNFNKVVSDFSNLYLT